MGEDWLSAIVANGRRANGALGSGALEVGEPADALVLDLDRLDRDAVLETAPLDYLFARATAAHIDALYVAGRRIVAQGQPTGIDLDAVQAELRAQVRERAPSRAGFLDAWGPIPQAMAKYFGCC